MNNSLRAVHTALYNHVQYPQNPIIHHASHLLCSEGEYPSSGHPSKLSSRAQHAILSQITMGKVSNAVQATKHINTIIPHPVRWEAVGVEAGGGRVDFKGGSGDCEVWGRKDYGMGMYGLGGCRTTCSG